MSAPSGPLRVLHVYRTYFPDTQGGAQETIRQICLNTAALGVESRVFTPSWHPDPEQVRVDRALVVRTKMHFEIASCGVCLTGLPEFRRQVEWAQIVHYHFPWPFADVMHFATRVQKPTVLTYHSDIVRQQGVMGLYSPLMHRFLSSVDQIVATSQSYAESSVVLRTYRHKVAIVPIGLNESSYPTVTPELKETCRQTYGEDFFLFVGVLRYYKGLHFLLDACRQSGFRVVIAGEGPLRPQLEREARGLSNVVFAGHVAEDVKMALLGLCRAVVFPSHVRAEAFGVTLVEGAMLGKALVCTDNGTGTTFVNRHEETGLVVPAGDAGQLRKALVRLHENEAEAQQFGRAARSRYELHLTGAKMAQAYHVLYQQVVDDQSRRSA